MVDQCVTDVHRVRVDARRQVSGGGLQRHIHTQIAVLLEPSMASMADAYEDASCACRKQEDGACVCPDLTTLRLHCSETYETCSVMPC